MKKAFTMIELLLVVVIIGILSAIVLLSINNARKDAQVTKTKGTMQQLSKAAQQYFVDKGYYPPDSQVQPDTCDTTMRTVWGELMPYANMSGCAIDGWGKVMRWDNFNSSNDMRLRDMTTGAVPYDQTDKIGIHSAGPNRIWNDTAADDYGYGIQNVPSCAGWNPAAPNAVCNNSF